MRVVFMGTPPISATCLRRLHDDGFELVGVYTKPDAPQNRGMKLAQSAVKELALALGLPVYQPTTFRDDAAVDALRALQPDLILVVAYGKILPQRVLDIARLGCVNIHASVLPALRGSGPVQWSILNGLDETGVTAMYMAAEMDAGDIIEIRKTPIDPMETAEELLGRLAVIGAQLLSETAKRFATGPVPASAQAHEDATSAPMLTKALAPIDWSRTDRQIVDQVRGLNPWPVATAELGGARFKIYRVEYTEEITTKTPGTLLALGKQGLTVACGGGKAVRIAILQAEGGKRMRAADYFRGHPIEIKE